MHFQIICFSVKHWNKKAKKKKIEIRQSCFNYRDSFTKPTEKPFKNTPHPKQEAPNFKFRKLFILFFH